MSAPRQQQPNFDGNQGRFTDAGCSPIHELSDAEAERFARALALALARIAAERAGQSSEVH